MASLLRVIYEERPCIERMQGILLKWTVQKCADGQNKAQ